MKDIDWKRYLTSQDFRSKISTSIRKHAKDLEKEIQEESKYNWKNEVIYV